MCSLMSFVKCIHSHIHLHQWFTEHVHHPRNFLCVPFQALTPAQSLFWFVLPHSGFAYAGTMAITQCGPLIWLISLFIIFLRFFLMWTIFKVFIEFVTIVFIVFYVPFFFFFGQKSWGNLSSPEMEPTPPALESEVLTTGPPGKS